MSDIVGATYCAWADPQEDMFMPGFSLPLKIVVRPLQRANTHRGHPALKGVKNEIHYQRFPRHKQDYASASSLKRVDFDEVCASSLDFGIRL